MKIQPIQLALAVACLLLFSSYSATAQDNNTKFSFSAGVDVTSGTYGGDEDIEDTYAPLTAKFDNGSTAFRITVPYLSVRAPEGTTFDSGGNPLPGSGDLTTESGLGDIIGSVTFYDVASSRRLGLALDLTGKVKLGTADEDKGLGTGETDYSVQADLFKFADKLTLMGSLGYKFRGDPSGVDLNNVLLASVGGTYRITPDVSSGLIFDYRESSISGDDSIQELTGFVSRRISNNWRLQFYALAGFTDSSPDWGAGMQIKRVMELER